MCVFINLFCGANRHPFSIFLCMTACCITSMLTWTCWLSIDTYWWHWNKTKTIPCQWNVALIITCESLHSSNSVNCLLSFHVWPLCLLHSQTPCEASCSWKTLSSVCLAGGGTGTLLADLWWQTWKHSDLNNNPLDLCISGRQSHI